MNNNLKKYITRAYPNHSDKDNYDSDYFLQIDDQNDNDSIQTFCNLFIIFKKNSSFELEISGRFPITPKMIDICEIHEGYTNKYRKTANLKLNIDRIDVIDELIKILKETSTLGDSVGNPQWDTISKRTINSLVRFSITVKDYISEKPPTSKVATLRQNLLTFFV